MVKQNYDGVKMEKIIDLSKQLSATNEQLIKCMELIESQKKDMEKLASNLSASVNATTLLFSILINSMPDEKQNIEDGIKDFLDNLYRADNMNGENAESNVYLESYLKQIALFLQAPQKAPHLRLLKNEIEESSD